MTSKSGLTSLFLAGTLAMAGCASTPTVDTTNLASIPIQDFKRISQRKGAFQFNDTGEVICEHRNLDDFPKSKPVVPTCHSLGIQKPRKFPF